MNEENVFDRVNSWIRDMEYSIVNLVSSIAPWLAPVIPAYLSYSHMIAFLEFPVWVSFIGAVVVEVLGLTTVHTVINFWNHNRKYSADKNKVPVGISIWTFVFYLGIVLTVNVMSEAAQFGFSVVVVAQALLTLMTIPAAITISIRGVLKEIKDDLKKPRTGGKKNLQQNSKSGEEYSDWRTLPHDDRMKVSTLSVKQISASYGVPDRTARNWKENAIKHAEQYVYGENEQ